MANSRLSWRASPGPDPVPPKARARLLAVLGSSILQPGATVVCVFAVATAVVLLGKPYLPILLLSSTYLLAIVSLAVGYGLGVGLVAAAFSSVACDCFFFTSGPGPHARVATDLLTIAIFVGGAVLGSRLTRTVMRRYEHVAQDQAALRHIAALVGRRFSPTEISAIITAEVARNSAAAAAHVVRYESNGTITVVASWGEEPLNVGENLPLDGPSVETLVRERERPSRIEDFAILPGYIAALVRHAGIRSEVGVPVLVDGHVWGAMIVSSTSPKPLPMDTEERISNFAELAGVAVSHAETRLKLIESRARLVASADDARERIERDLHDSVQQQLISVALRLHASQGSSDNEAVTRTLETSEAALAQVIKEIRVIVHGLLPPVLTQAGLGPALRALARHAAVPTRIHVDLPDRLPKEIEAATYFVVSEALTNATKHARASRVTVDVAATGEALRACVADDGVGGADTSVGSGLSGLANRAEALGGWLSVRSLPGEGTSVTVELPLDGLAELSSHRAGRAVRTTAHRY